VFAIEVKQYANISLDNLYKDLVPSKIKKEGSISAESNNNVSNFILESPSSYLPST
jgi:hypothetical protein